MTRKKNNGVYYTPSRASMAIAEYIAGKCSYQSILEPSCGDGSFLCALFSHESIVSKVTAVDKDARAIKLAKRNLSASMNKTKFVNDDFVDFLKENKKRYDLVIGNPPYVNKKAIGLKHQRVANQLYKHFGYEVEQASNLWEIFVLGAIKMVSDKGVICFVLPAEILQVNYCANIRELLLKEFESIEVLSFDECLFPEIQQEVVVICASKKDNLKGLRFRKFNRIEDLSKNKARQSFTLDRSLASNRWNGSRLLGPILSDVELLANMMRKAGDFADLSPGVITGANDYFLQTSENVKFNRLDKYAIPIISASRSRKGIIYDWDQTFVEDNKYLIDFKSKKLSKYAFDYIRRGVEQSVNETYKCRIRKNWYEVPLVEPGELIFFKRAHEFPRLMLNESRVICTDSAYCVRMREGYERHSFLISFYNSLTLLFSELQGRSYGGGVLELTPNEFRSLPIPYVKFNKRDLARLNKKLVCGSFEEIVAEVDQMILIKYLGLDQSVVRQLQEVRMSLSEQRIKKKKTISGTDLQDLR